MSVRSRRSVVTLVGLVAVGSACGGAGPAPKVAEPPPPPAAPAPPAAPTPAAKEPAKTAADHHREFMGGCAKRAVNSPDYCECAWGELRKTFSDDELNAGELPPAKLERLKGQVTGACASKIPEEVVKTSFQAGCVGKNAEMKSYCECTWTEFRKRFSALELGDEATVQSERFVAARAPVVKVCGGKMPESVSKEAFLKGCAKDPSADKFCACAWKELRKVASPAEIETASFDQKAIFAKVDKGCGSLRPSGK
jgi:hypothetical protein